MLTVTTWNVQNLFPAGSADGPNTQNQYDDKLDALADTVQALAPDVLALQEIGDTACLQDLLGRVGGIWHTACRRTPTPAVSGLGSRHGYRSPSARR